MPTDLALDDHVAAIAQRAEVLRDAAERAGLGAAVPTCPKWTVADLLTHQGMVHRWAAAHLRGDKGHRTSDSTAAAAAAPDLLAWFAEGAEVLLATIETTPDDAKAMVFLNDAPPPRRFWARRQAHETTIHSVDAVAAELGRLPTESEVNIPQEVAVDGIDELLRGFITRGKGKLNSIEPYTICVSTADTGNAWTIMVGNGSLVTSSGHAPDADATMNGSAVQLYIGLWNRGDEITARGREDVLAQWREQVRVRWS